MALAGPGQCSQWSNTGHRDKNGSTGIIDVLHQELQPVHEDFSSDSPVNAMTVDVEDYFQVSAFEGAIDRNSWEDLPSRLPDTLKRITELFDAHNIKATFFTLGWVAEKFPTEIRRLAEQGHEIASHGFGHTRVTTQDPASFRADVSRTKAVLEDITGHAVRGYRAASYSIGAGNLWALEVLAETGHEYSSSIYPIRHDTYGMPDAPRFACRYGAGGLLELPVTTVRLLRHNFPGGGGGYFRLLPYAWSRWAIRRVNQKDKQPSIFYFHPWEIDPEQPRVNNAGLKSRLRHYVNLDKMEGKLTRLLKDFRWDRMDRVFLNGSGSQ